MICDVIVDRIVLHVIFLHLRSIDMTKCKYAFVMDEVIKA